MRRTVSKNMNLTVFRLIFQDQFTNKNTNGTWSNILVGLPHYWNSDPYKPHGGKLQQMSQNTQHESLQNRHQRIWPDHRRGTRGYSVHSHLFRNLEPDTRYEVIVQSQNEFGWSEPTKPFIFSTRYQGNCLHFSLTRWKLSCILSKKLEIDLV